VGSNRGFGRLFKNVAVNPLRTPVSKPSRLTVSIIGILMAGIFCGDIVLPLGIPAWVPYLVPVLLAFWLPYRQAPGIVAGVSCFLILLGFYLSPAGLHLRVALMNRVFGTVGLLVTAVLLTWMKRANEVLEGELSERRRTETALRISEEEYRALFDLAGVGKAQVETMTGRFLRVNHKLCDITGYPCDELLTMTFRDLTHPEDREQDWAAFQDLVSGRRAGYSAEKRYIRRNGAVRWVQVTRTLVRQPDGRARHTVAVIQDITDRKEAEEHLRSLTTELEERVRERTTALRVANERLQEHDRLKTAFVSIVSHELRTPLTSIKGYVQNLLDRVPGPLTEKQDYYLKRMLHQIERLSRIIRDLLDLSRIEAGRIDLQWRAVSLADLIGEVLESFQPIARKKLITLQSHVPRRLPCLRADRDKLHQILTNLLENAMKFTESNGEVQVDVSLREEGFVQICISDTGCGIPHDELPKVFDSFYRGSECGQAEGVGLGLAITRRLVELHGGKIWADSTFGVGSRFYVALPLRFAMQE
jgi:PAS domain S-box-containing protein